MPLNAMPIVTLAELREHLGLTAGVAEADDAMLERNITDAKGFVESWLGHRIAGAGDGDGLWELAAVLRREMAHHGLSAPKLSLKKNVFPVPTIKHHTDGVVDSVN